MQVLCKQIDCNSDSLQERHVQMQFRLLAVKVGLATWSPQRIVFTKQTRRQKCIYCIHVANKEFASRGRAVGAGIKKTRVVSQIC